MQHRYRTVGLLLLLAMLVGGASWLLTRGNDAARAVETGPVITTPTANVDAPRARVLTEPTRVETPREAEVTSDIASTSAAELECVGGMLVFPDGSAPPPCRIRFEPYDPDARRISRSEGVFSVETDESGRFMSDRACSGRFTARLHSFGGNLSIPGIFELPARDLRLVFPGYLLRVRVVDAQQLPVPSASVIAFYSADPTLDHPRPVRIQLDRGTNDDGITYVHVEDAGDVVLSATLGRLTAREETVSLRSVSGLVTHELVMLADQRVASMRVVVHACGDPSALIRDFCVVFHDAKTGNRELRLCSENIPLDGIVDTLRVGQYRVRPALRYLGEPAYYLKPTPASEVVLDLQEGRMNEVRLCVEVGGRIAMLARVAGDEAGTLAGAAEAKLVAEDGSAKPTLSFREPDETGVTMASRVPFGVERVTEDVFVPGEYRLRIVAKGFHDVERSVFVRAGELSKIDVLLTPID